MPTGVHVQKDIPKNKLNVVVAGYKAQGATVETKLQDNGKYTVIATFPDTPTDD